MVNVLDICILVLYLTKEKKIYIQLLYSFTHFNFLYYLSFFPPSLFFAPENQRLNWLAISLCFRSKNFEVSASKIKILNNLTILDLVYNEVIVYLASVYMFLLQRNLTSLFRLFPFQKHYT